MKNVNSRAALRNLTLKALVVVAAFSAASSAQAATANINATATIIPPLALAQPAAIRFGNIAATATAGTVVMDPPATLPAVGPTTAAPVLTSTRVATGPVAVGGNCAGTVVCGVGSLLITGLANGSFATVTVPATVTLASGVNTMVLTTASRYGIINTAGVTTGAGTLSATGAANILVGGSLAVGAAQVAGAYTIAVPITIDY